MPLVSDSFLCIVTLIGISYGLAIICALTHTAINYVRGIT